MHLGCMQIQCMTVHPYRLCTETVSRWPSVECYYALVLSSLNKISAYLSHFFKAHAAFVQEETEV